MTIQVLIPLHLSPSVNLELIDDLGYVDAGRFVLSPVYESALAPYDPRLLGGPKLWTNSSGKRVRMGVGKTEQNPRNVGMT